MSHDTKGITGNICHIRREEGRRKNEPDQWGRGGMKGTTKSKVRLH